MEPVGLKAEGFQACLDELGERVPVGFDGQEGKVFRLLGYTRIQSFHLSKLADGHFRGQ
jgi:hypothetical protein